MKFYLNLIIGSLLFSSLVINGLDLINRNIKNKILLFFLKFVFVSLCLWLVIYIYEEQLRIIFQK